MLHFSIVDRTSVWDLAKEVQNLSEIISHCQKSARVSYIKLMSYPEAWSFAAGTQAIWVFNETDLAMF